MKLSAPIFSLKRQAKLLSRTAGIPLHAALDRIAVQENYANWSLLAAKWASSPSAASLFAALIPGDLVLLGARPGQGKTLMSLRLAVEAIKAGHRAFIFTLEETEKGILDRFAAIGAGRHTFEPLLDIDCSDQITADYIADRLTSVPCGTFVVVDYLQLLDQKRDTPELETQVRGLKALAGSQGLILVLLSQIHRSYDPSKKPVPDSQDVRLPNPLDLRLFDKTCFLNGGKVHFQ